MMRLRIKTGQRTVRASARQMLRGGFGLAVEDAYRSGDRGAQRRVAWLREARLTRGRARRMKLRRGVR